MRTAGVHSKFGIPLFEIDELVELREEGRRAHRRPACAHGQRRAERASAWLDTGRQLLKLLEQLPDVRYIDVGGGLGVPEKAGQPASTWRRSTPRSPRSSKAAAAARCSSSPGASSSRRPACIVARVTQTKGKGDVQYVGVGTGMNSLIRPALYGAYHEIVNLTRLGKPATELVTVVGPICETGDRLGSDRLLPAAKENDVLLIANAGAYGYAMSSRYNLREPAVEVLI